MNRDSKRRDPSRRKTLRGFGLEIKQKLDKRKPNNNNHNSFDDDARGFGRSYDMWRTADDKKSGVCFKDKVNRDGTARWFIGKDYINPLLKVCV